MSNRAWVTLATNDSYGLGAMVLAHSLRRAGSIYPAAVLITPSVTEAMRERLRAVFSEVVVVDVLDSRDAAHLALLQRPELGITFTKIHCWGLTQYEKCVFLDADTLVVQNCDELFEREELSAAPDVGWPDCFNSGVFVYKPSQETLEQLIKFAKERGSFDGGDQGLLNSFFSDWARGDINKHLPFLYNVTSAAFYSYIPALKHYGQNLKIIHFIGTTKPWLQQFNWESRSVNAPEHLREFLQLWWDLFVGQVHSQLDVTMSGVAGNLARVVPGAASSQREALDELTRRQGWEAGNIDYMGADSFDNIWAKISQTLSKPRVSPPKQPSPPKEPSPPKQPSPPKEPSPPKQPSPPKEVPVEVAQEATVIDAASTLVSEPVVEAVAEVKSESAPVVEAAAVPVEAAPGEAASAPVEAAPASVAAAPAPVATDPAPVEVAPAPVEAAPVAVESAPVPIVSPPALIESTPASVEVIPAPVESAPVAEAPKSVAVPASEVEVETKPPEKVPVASEPEPVLTPVEATPAPLVEASVAAVPAEITAVDAASEVKSAEIPATVEASAAAPPDTKEIPATVEASAAGEQPKEKTSKTEPALPLTPPDSPKSEEKAAPVKVVKEASPVAPLPVTTPEKSSDATVCSDSPPLANTPSKDEAPTLPAAKSTEEAAQETRL